MNDSVHPYLDAYTNPDGTLRWKDPIDADLSSRDGADDFYEAFYNWPLFYLLGGGDHLLGLAHQEWIAVTEQLTTLGLVENGYEKGYDQFHQSEGYLFFYFLCLADPAHPKLREQAARFASLFLGDNEGATNYDAERKLIRAPHNGSAGARPGLTEGDPVYRWSPRMTQYGLPLHDVPGITSYDDLQDEAVAVRMGEAMFERMGRGDVPANLAITSLVTTAYLLTGTESYRSWVLDYVEAWNERTTRNGGMIPDNIGLSGEIGEYQNGNWYGGHYGWTWPHGFYNIGAATTVATANAVLLTGNTSYLDLARTQIERILELGDQRIPKDQNMSLAHHWIGQLHDHDENRPMLMVPYRYGPDGWFDYQPLPPIYPLAIWTISNDTADWARVEHLRNEGGYAWDTIVPFHNKEDSGHEEPWTRFLRGELPDYPERILAAAYSTVCQRLEKIRTDRADLTQVHIHHWQQVNPITTEALVQLMLGVPQHVYYGGLLHARVRYFDAELERPGLPADVAALVTGTDLTRTGLTLVNLSPFGERRLIVQAGTFAEHHIETVQYEKRTSAYPGAHEAYAPPPLTAEMAEVRVDGRWVEIVLPPATTITLQLHMTRYIHSPSAGAPWEQTS